MAIKGLYQKGFGGNWGGVSYTRCLPVRIRITARQGAGELIVVESHPHGEAAYALVTHQGQDEVGFARGFIQNLALDGVGVNIGDEARPLFLLLQDGPLDKGLGQEREVLTAELLVFRLAERGAVQFLDRQGSVEVHPFFEKYSTGRILPVHS